MLWSTLRHLADSCFAIWWSLVVVLLNLGVYGDVFRVKIMFNKKDTALVQFADPAQAQIGELTHRLLLYILCFLYY